MGRRRHADPHGGSRHWVRAVLLACIPAALLWARFISKGHAGRVLSTESPPARPAPQPSLQRLPAQWAPAIVLFCHARPHYLNQTLASLSQLPGLRNYSVYVSQDGVFANVSETISGFNATLSRKARTFEHWQKVRPPGKKQGGPAWISQHYKWGLSRIFEERNHSHAIVLEEDMLLSPDFLHLFESTAWLLDADPTLWCVSSWNDNCYAEQHAWNATRLFRNSYFPGLGWMLKRETFAELKPSWIEWGNWDEGLRTLPESISRRRDCICPELSRNRNIGATGVNMDAGWFEMSFQTLAWSQSVSDFGDMSYLLHEAYDKAVRQGITSAAQWSLAPNGTAQSPIEPGRSYLVKVTKEDWPRVAAALSLWRHGPMRGHYRHVAIVPWRGATFYIADTQKCTLLS